MAGPNISLDLFTACKDENSEFRCLDVRVFSSIAILPLTSCGLSFRLDEIHNLVRMGADVNYKGSHANTALHYAVGNNKYKLAHMLIHYGADVNAINSSYHRTPLHMAAVKHLSVSEAIVRLLHENNCDFDLKDKFKKRAIDYVSQEYPEIRRVWAELSGVTEKRKIVIIETKEPVVTGEVVVRRGKVNYGGNKRKSKFHEMNKELRDLTFYNCSNEEKDKLQRIHTLLTEGTDVDFKGPHGDTALHKAADRDETDLAKLLISFECDVNLQSDTGRTPLHRAAANGSAKVCEILIANGAKLNVRNHYGLTPLHQAALFDQRETARLLVSAGCDIYIKDWSGKTAIDQVEGKHLKQMWYDLINAQRLENERLAREAKEEEQRKAWEEKMRDAAARKAEEERIEAERVAKLIEEFEKDSSKKIIKLGKGFYNWRLPAPRKFKPDEDDYEMMEIIRQQKEEEEKKKKREQEMLDVMRDPSDSEEEKEED